MAEKELTVKEARDKIEDLENFIFNAVEDYEKETGVVVSSIEIKRLNTRKFDDKREDYRPILNHIKIETHL